MLTTPLLPPLPPPTPTGLVIIFGQAQWQNLMARTQAMYDASEIILEKLGTFIPLLEKLMTQDDELTAAVAANTTAMANVTAMMASLDDAIQAEIASVANLTNLLSAGPAPDPAVAQAIADVQASNAALSALQADMSSDISALQASLPPSPPSGP